MDTTRNKLSLERDARAGHLLTQLTVKSVYVHPKRRNELWKRIDRLRAYRATFWTPERLRTLCCDDFLK